MHPIYNYDVYIFDCDGIILDSNVLKIDAMKKTLTTIFKDDVSIENCINYFKKNFGKSRFHHVDIFLENYLSVSDQSKEKIRKKILTVYSLMCKELYLDAKLTPGFIDFVKTLQGKKIVVSGSEQEELREVFRQRGLNVYFDEIFGSPTTKNELVSSVLKNEDSDVKVIMFGDALSDLHAAVENNIAFIAYLAFSNVKKELQNEALSHGYPVINSWSFNK